MTAAEYQAQHGKKPISSAATPRSGAGQHNPVTEPPSAPTSDEMPPAHFTQPTGAATWLLGPYSLSLAAPFSPGRMRVVLTGPLEEGLLRVVHDAIADFLTSKNYRTS